MLASSAVRNTPSSKHYAVSILADQHAVRHVVKRDFGCTPAEHLAQARPESEPFRWSPRAAKRRWRGQ